MDDRQTEEPVDPIDLLVNYVPKHLWVTIFTVATMLVVSWLFFKPPLPEVETTTGETLEGRIVEVLAEEKLRVAEQAQPVQRALVEITRGSLKGQRVEVLHGQVSMLTEGTRVQSGDRVLLEHDSGPDGEGANLPARAGAQRD